jgi:phage tail-like protein
MPSRDSNNATWYVLRAQRDFVAHRPDPARPWLYPELDASLTYDAGRHVLELAPATPAKPSEPPRGIAVDVTGEIYWSDAAAGTVRVRRCNGCDAELVCERDVFAQPAGLALDRRGLLYVADPMAGRVVVAQPDDGSVAGVLADGLKEPVDVVVAANGWIFVADRKAGEIVVFSPRLDRCASFVPRGPQPDRLPLQPQPIAVTIDADGALLVADAMHPRLLRFDDQYRPLADLVLPIGGALDNVDPLALDAVKHVYGGAAPRFLAGACATPRPRRDGGLRLLDAHRAIRLLLLRLSRSFAPCGSFVSAVLDGGTPGVQWHKIEVDGVFPPGTWIKVQTVTAETPSDLASIAFLDLTSQFAPLEDITSCAAKPKAPFDVPDRLVQSVPGRFLRLRLVLGSNGSATPSVRAVRVFHPRVSYLDMLPPVYRRDAESALFLEHFLALFEHIFTDAEDRYELFSRQLNPDAAPSEIIDWLACLVDLVFDPSWPLTRRRALLAEAIALYRARGTPGGLARYIEIYTGVRPAIVEGFLDRPTRAPLLGLGAVIGCSSSLAPPGRLAAPDDALVARYAHRFAVVVYVDEACDEQVLLSVVDRIVTVNKPAHTVHTLRAVYTDARVGEARVGLDVMLGAREQGRLRLGGCAEPGAPSASPSRLGADAILGALRPQYARPAALELS